MTGTKHCKEPAIFRMKDKTTKTFLPDGIDLNNLAHGKYPIF